MNIYLTALGCKLNQAEIESLARRVVDAGHTVVADPGSAEWAIINTCTVTHVADKKSRQLIRQLHRANPAMRIAVIGCYGEMSATEAARLAGVALVAPNRAKDEVLESLLALSASAPSESPVDPPPLLHTRALVKIQDGCDNRCSYCIVGIARGPQRSCPPEDVLAEVRRRLAEGYREVVLTGVNIGAYGRDSAADGPLPSGSGWSLARLVRLVLAESAVPRLRVSSIEPWDVTPELLDLWQDARLCRHLHLPMQSGCDATLRRMRRRNTCEELADVVRAARQRIAELALTTDIIVGFPGETDAEFAETLACVEQLAPARLHVFVYSRRPGTAADTLPDQVPPPVARTRSAALIALGRSLARSWHAGYLGREVEILCEQPRSTPAGLEWSGLTDNYMRVRLLHEGDLHNRLARVLCTSADAQGLRGTLVTAER